MKTLNSVKALRHNIPGPMQVCSALVTTTTTAIPGKATRRQAVPRAPTARQPLDVQWLRFIRTRRYKFIAFYSQMELFNMIKNKSVLVDSEVKEVNHKMFIRDKMIDTY
ncbi:hypothetical protein EAG_16243 [Camponotus floridanus]|uniref:Uncharacterized protein n=1 Tax=Camponotus floridanus TaxID=104421 RepID=E2AG71_CAMFO|nr:hypothetical protein EAG_16243 [Camponotus floridanus]